jgi:hypothetical protein
MTTATDPTLDPDLAFTEADDELHPVGTGSLDWTETSWWSFNVPGRALGGWLYAQLRPNLGTVAGGAFVWDASTALPWELPFYAYFHHLPIPEACDLRDVTFRNGVSIRLLEPGMRYRLGYRFREERDFTADLLFEGITPPIPYLPGDPPFAGSSHYDQPGHITGTISLRGETVAVDCLSMRDRSWGRRPELAGRYAGDRVSYAFGVAGPDDAFLAFCQPPPGAPGSDVERLRGGFLLRDGELWRLTSAERRVRRDAATGRVRELEIDAVDSAGRELCARGEARSGMVLHAHSLCLNSLVHWEFDGKACWGEDQDVWSVSRFADRPR